MNAVIIKSAKNKSALARPSKMKTLSPEIEKSLSEFKDYLSYERGFSKATTQAYFSDLKVLFEARNQYHFQK